MSKGLGRVQRDILAILQAEVEPVPTPVIGMMLAADEDQRAKFRDQPIGIRMVAVAMIGGVPKGPGAPLMPSVSRACHSLWRAGRVDKWGLNGCSLWSIKP